MRRGIPQEEIERSISVAEKEYILDTYQCAPFCNPEDLRRRPIDIVGNYDPKRYADSSTLRHQALHVYELEKNGHFWKNLEKFDNIPPVDLTQHAALLGMQHHVFTHSGAGMVRWGTSNTSSIPYWDREAYIQAVNYRYDNDDADEVVAHYDALNINFLRSFIEFLLQRTNEYARDCITLDEALNKGQRTREDISHIQAEELHAVQHEYAIFSGLSKAKIKHLMWLVDQQSDPALRHLLLPELTHIAERSEDIGIHESDLSVDMGIDTGISEDTHRPAYVISAFRQLSHVKESTYSLNQDQCHVIGLQDMLRSIERQDNSQPFYEDGRYQLPWNFNQDLDIWRD